MADETRDISGNEQTSIVIRFADRHATTTSSSYNLLHEQFLGFERLHQFDAQSLAQELIGFLRQYQIEPSNCICQCYDGYVDNTPSETLSFSMLPLETVDTARSVASRFPPSSFQTRVTFTDEARPTVPDDVVMDSFRLGLLP